MACVLYRIFLIISCTTILFSIEDNTTAAVENSSFTRADTLWIYGDSVAKDFLKSLRLRGICRKIFKNANIHIFGYTRYEATEFVFHRS